MTLVMSVVMTVLALLHELAVKKTLQYNKLTYSVANHITSCSVLYITSCSVLYIIIS